MNKLILSLCLIFAPMFAGAATITRYVNTASSGGDGTTNNTSGSDAAYADFSAFEAAEQCDLTDNGGDVMEVYCYGTTADDTATLDGWTTNETNRINIHGDNNTGVYSTSYYRFAPAEGGGLNILNTNVTLDKIQFSTEGNSDYETCLGINLNFRSAGKLVVKNCIFRRVNQERGQQYGISIDNLQANTTVQIYNNMVYYVSHGVVNGGNADSYTYIYNNTFHKITGPGVEVAITQNTGNVYCKNNIISECDSDYSGTIVSSVTNITSNSVSFVDGTTFATYNLKLQSSDTTAKDNGTNLSADAGIPFNVDIVNTSRPQGSAWDVGAHEVTQTSAAKRRRIITTICQ